MVGSRTYTAVHSKGMYCRVRSGVSARFMLARGGQLERLPAAFLAVDRAARLGAAVATRLWRLVVTPVHGVLRRPRVAYIVEDPSLDRVGRHAGAGQPVGELLASSRSVVVQPAAVTGRSRLTRTSAAAGSLSCCCAARVSSSRKW